jgi:polyisoprenyl-phosphate glycosyltransferase
MSVDRNFITILCAVHNEEPTIPLFYQRIKKVLADVQCEFELVFLNNSSDDNSLLVIEDIMKSDPSVRVLSLSRNFGYQCSLRAGMEHARGEAIITIDVDCEDPPELIPKFVEQWRAGYEIVYGQREGRPEPKVLTMARKLFYHILKMTSDSDIILHMAEFGLISSVVRDQIVCNSNTFPFLRTAIAYAGFSRVGIPYDREERIAGETHYNFWRMFIFAVGGILSSSTFPLRFAAYLLPLIIMINLLFCGLLFGVSDRVQALLFLIDFCYISAMLVFHGVYLARIYKNGLGRPIYIVDWQNSSEELKR